MFVPGLARTAQVADDNAADGTPPTVSAHARQMEEMPVPSKILSEDQQEASALEAAGLLFPKPAGPTLQAATPAVASDSIVFGYIQSESIVYHLRWHALTHIGSLFVDFNSSGGFNNLTAWTGRSTYLKAGGAADAAGVKVVMVVRNEGFNETTLATVMQSAGLRQTLANNVISAVTADTYCAGVSFDFEFSWTAATRDGITAFLSYLRSNLPSQYEISVYTHAIYNSTYWNVSGIEPNIDYMLYSTYDWASGNTAHAISDFNNCDNYIENYFSAGLPPSKMVLVWASYSRRWTGITTYNATGSNPSSRGFTDGLFDTTFNTNFGGPYTNNYVTGDEGAWYTYNDGGNDYVVTWDSPESMEFKLRSSLVFPGATSTYAGVRLRGVGFWSLMWLAETSSYTGNTLDGGPGTVGRSRTYPHVYQLCEEIFDAPGTTRHLFDGYEGYDYRWRDPNTSPDTVGDTDNNSVQAIVSAPAGSGRPPSTTNAMQVTFDFEGSTGNKLFFRHEVLGSPLVTTGLDPNATAVHFDSSTKVSAYIYTPAAYSGYTVRMVAMDANRQLEASDPYSLNASGWRLIEWDLTDATQINAVTTSEWGFSNGNGTLNTAGGGAEDLGFVGFLIEGNGAIVGNVVFDELAYEHVNPAGKNYTINEFRYNDIAAEFVEIYGPAGAFPAGLQLRTFDSADGSVLDTYSLGGLVVPDDGGGFGHFVIGDPGVPNVDSSTGFTAATDDLPNVNPSALQLYDTGTGCVYDSAAYEAFGGLADLVRRQTLGVTSEGYPWMGEVANGSTAAGVMYTMGRYPDGTDTQQNNEDFSVMAASPGAANGNSVTLPVTYDFSAAPTNAFQTYQPFHIADPTGAGLPASPGGGNAHRSVDTTGGGVMSFFGDAALGDGGGGYAASGSLYIPAAAEPAQAIAIGLCGRQGSTFFTNTPGPSGYESGYMLIYENAAGVGLNNGRPDHAGTFEFVHATHDHMDSTPVALLGSATRVATGAAAGAWTTFELTVDPTAAVGQQLIARINGYTIFSGAIPSGGPTSGAFQVGFRENHSGGPAANEGTWIDDLSLTTVAAVGVSIDTHPLSQTKLVGESVTFTVVAYGTAPIDHQWYEVGTPDQLISGETSNSYTIPSVALADVGQYFCRVSNSVNTVDSNAATLTVQEGVVITVHPASQSISKNSPVTFTVSATGIPAPTYQWYKVGTPDQLISGETSNSYTIPSVQDADAGQYFCRATNVVNSADSNAATLTVLPPTGVQDWMLFLLH